MKPYRALPAFPLALALLLFPANRAGIAQENPSEKAAAKTAAEYDREAQTRISGFTLPDDISATLFADESQIQNPSMICFDHAGHLYVAEIHRWRAGVEDIRHEQRLLLEDIRIQTNEDRLAMYEGDQLTRPLSHYTEFEDQIVVVEDRSGDGRADHSRVWADGFNDVLDGPGIGLVAGPDNDIYYTNIPHLWHLRDTNDDGVADERTSLQDGFGVRMSISGHDMHGIVWGPDGRLYWSIGDRGYSLTTKEGRHYHRPYEGGVFRCDPDGSNLEEIYRGLRNPQELAFDQYGNLFTCDNDADAWDTGRLVYIMEGGNSGWHHGHQVLLNFRNQLELRTPDYDHPDRKTIPMNPWMTEAIWEPHHAERPAYALPPVETVSWGPSGFVYNYGVTTMPERYAEHFWVCNFGGAKGDLEAFTVKEDGAGFALDQHEVFMVGLGNTDVEFGPDGRMYVSCFNNNGWLKEDIGNIYALAAKDPPRPELLEETHGVLVSDFSTFKDDRLDTLLGHADMRVRQRAQFEIASRGTAEIFLAAIAQTENRLKRLHGVWGLGQLTRSDEALLEVLVAVLEDSDAEVRAQAVKVLADSRTPAAGEALASVLDDPSDRVRAFAAIGVGKCGNVMALPRILEILAENDNKDVFLRHACVQAIWYLNEREKILKETKHESAAVRLGVLLALRKLEDPRVKYFLDDSDPFIRDEAIRAINDLDLFTALPDLAERIAPFANASEGITLPETHRDWMTQTRLINANFRAGTPANASLLLTYAAQAKLPLLLREQALHALLEWKEPKPVDSTNGFYRPLDPDDRTDITDAVKEGVGAVFEAAEGNLLSLATQLALDYGAKAPEDLLLQQVLDEEANPAARIGSLRGLARQNAAAIEEHWDTLLQSPDALLKAATVRALRGTDSSAALAAALDMAASDELRHRQQGYRLLASFDEPEANEVFQTQLARLDSEKPGALLDLLESAGEKREHPEIAALLTAYEESLDPADPVAPYLPALEGGNVEKGRELFMTHAAGQCSKCHKVNGDGGIAGPDLTGIGSRHEARYLLESLVAPSAVIVEGYGMMIMTLKNGETVGGTLLKEAESGITLKLPDPDNSVEQVEKTFAHSEIESRQPPVSAMPAAGLFMSKSEIRDLVAFLGSLQEKKEEKDH